jgi:NADH-quinone oxidoreductase subunit G
MPDLVTLTIDGVPVTVPKGTLLVEAAKKIKQEIPVYCYHTKLGPAGLCRVCLVEIEGMPKLQIACNTQVADGMVVRTQNDRVNAGRSMIVELLLVNHPLDCPICDKGGECDLQDYAMAYGRGASTMVEAKTKKPKAVDLGPTIVLDEERCIVCQRCVRFDDIIANERQLVVKDRGARDIIATSTGDEYRHNFTGNVTEICPVGALTSKTYRFRSRPWDLERTKTTCTQCAVGCQMYSDVRFGGVLRTMSVEEDDAISDGWLCDRGRYNIGFYSSRDRITQPLYKEAGGFVQIGWDDAFALWGKAIKDGIATSGRTALGAIGGGRLTNEEAYLLQHLFRSLGVNNVDWRAGAQRQATPGGAGASIASLEDAQAIVVLGESPAELAPVLELRIRKAVRKNGARVFSAVSASDAMKLLGTQRRRVAIVWDGVDVALAKPVYDAAAGVHDVSTYIAGSQGNARGAEAMGMLPHLRPGYAATDKGASSDELFDKAYAGELAVLSVFGANPALNHPDGPRVRDALAKVNFLVVSDLFLTETAQAATLVLPAKGAFEKTGTTLNLAGDLLPVEASLLAPDGVLSDLEMLIGLAEQLGVNMPTTHELDAAVIAAAARPTSGIHFGDPSFGQGLRSAQRGEGLQLQVETRLFAGGGTASHDPRIGELRPLPEAAVCPQDAQLLGLSTGDYVDLAVGDATIHDLLIEVRAGVASGSVVLIGGLPDDPANELGAGVTARVTNVRKGADLVEA